MFRTTCKVLPFFSILFVMVAIATNVGLAQTTSSPAVLGKTSLQVDRERTTSLHR